MFDKKIETKIVLPNPVPCPHCNMPSAMMLPIYKSRTLLSNEMIISWKCNNCEKEII